VIVRLIIGISGLGCIQPIANTEEIIVSVHEGTDTVAGGELSAMSCHLAMKMDWGLS
jgi:hypothetical protein